MTRLVPPNLACPCHSGRKYKRCCGPLHSGRPAESPEALMRSRFAAYAVGLVDYLLATTVPAGPAWEGDLVSWRTRTADFCSTSSFRALTITEATAPSAAHPDRGDVVFHADIRALSGADRSIHERSHFLRIDGRWLYHSGELGEASPVPTDRDEAPQTEPSLSGITDELEASGYPVDALRAIQDELNCLERPPGFWSRLSRDARESAARHWAFVLGELHESAEAAAILGRSITSPSEVNAEDRDKLRSQLLDLIRAVPAAVVAAANAALPIPCTSLATPWLLHRLGVMPSHWREAHLLDSLQSEVDKLRQVGLSGQAKKLEEIRADIEDEAFARERVEHDARLLTHWDANNDGRWDESERAAYRAAVDALAARAQRSATRRSWYLLHEGGVFGPVRLSNFLTEEQGSDLLVCWEGRSGWVALSDLPHNRSEP